MVVVAPPVAVNVVVVVASTAAPNVVVGVFVVFASSAATNVIATLVFAVVTFTL